LAWAGAQARTLASLPVDALLAALIAACLIVGLALLFLPAYPRHTYLATASSLIPPVSVYLDAENQLPEATTRSFMTLLMKHLNGRRADLLYFLDASETARSSKYKALYRFGFRPIDVPHDPTGTGVVKEAVDKELAMHAYERALLGPPNQEFIIITGDGDFVPLLYRLSAAGHQVELWATPVRPAYRVLKTYLDMNVLDLAQALSELELAPDEVASAGPSSGGVVGDGRSRRESFRPQRPRPPNDLSDTGEEQLYQVIAETLDAHDYCVRRGDSDNSSNTRFRSLLGAELGSRLASVGYAVGSKVDYWIEHLIALGVLAQAPGRAFVGRGAVHGEDAAKALFAMVKSAAVATVRSPQGEDGRVTMSAVAAALAGSDQINDALRALVISANAKNATHTRYFVRAARALGLLAFDDVRKNPDVIRSPRLSAVFAEEMEPAEAGPAPDLPA
jgi:hypothetical protein